jgi:hypothetical protein
VRWASILLSAFHRVYKPRSLLRQDPRVAGLVCNPSDTGIEVMTNEINRFTAAALTDLGSNGPGILGEQRDE